MAEQINFESLNLKMSENIKKYTPEKQKMIFDYLNSLDEINKKGYIIAFDHLGSSFNIEKSNGFIKWCQKNNIK
jgi:hypothetical protein